MFKIHFGRNLRDKKKADFVKDEASSMSFMQIASTLKIPEELISAGTDPIASREAALEAQTPPVSPGELISISLKERGFSQADMARMLRLSRAQVTHLIQGKRLLTVEYAVTIGHALGIPPHVLLRMQADYLLYQYYREPTDASRLNNTLF